MSILIHTCSFPCSIRVTACPPPPPLHPTTPIVRRKTTFTRRRGLCEKSSFARSHLSREEAFARKYFSEKNAWFKPINSGHRIVLFESRTLRSFTHLHYPTEERTLGSAWVAGVSRISGNLSRSPPANFLRERLYFAPFFTPNDLCANEREQGFTYVH